MRRIGAFTNLADDDSESQARNAAFLQTLQQLGWTDGRNVRIDFRWGAGDADRNQRYASELVALAPDVILATGSPTVEPLRRVTREIPIVRTDHRSGRCRSGREFGLRRICEVKRRGCRSVRQKRNMRKGVP